MTDFLDPTHLIDTFGLAGTMAVLFAECGLLIGFFLPGDSLLFTAGLLAAGGRIAPLWVMLILLPVAAILGNLVGYWIGRSAGPSLFDRPDSRLFKKEHLERSHEFFERNGTRTVLLARFVPIVRTFVTVLAGVSRMDFRKFFILSVIGGILWAGGVTALGYWLGQIDVVRNHLELFILAVVAISLVPVAIEVIRSRRTSDPLV